MRSLLATALLVLAACGGNPLSPKTAFARSVQAGTVFFRMDPVSCIYTTALTTTFIINNVEVGTETLAKGETSKGYPANGSPVVQAHLLGWTSVYFTTPGGFWTHRNTVNVPDGGSVTHIFTC